MKQNIIGTVTWDRRTALCKQYGFCAAIIYAQPAGWPNGAPACDHRLKVKEFLHNKLGRPMHLDYYNQWQNTDSDWLVYKSAEQEYTVAVKDPRLITLLSLL